jgi:hypothetical protein
MLRFRPTAALAGMIPAVAVVVGVVSCPAGTRPAPAPIAGGRGAASIAAGRSAAASSGVALTVASRPAAGRPAAKISRSAFRVAITRHYGQPANASGYSVILVTGARQAWAFGGTNPGGPSTPVAVRWNGRTLATSALPGGLTGFITGASAAAANDVWAASQYGRYVLHWNGRHWHVAAQWRHGQITGLTAISASDVWSFGTTLTGLRVLGTWHFDGKSWQPVAGLGRSIYRASAVSHRDIWAIGATRRADYILRYNGHAWRRLPAVRALAGVQPRDILAISNHNVWVAANQVNRLGVVRLVLAHWNGTRWTRLVSGLRAWAGRLAPGSGGGVLLTATPASASATGLILHAWPGGWGATIIIQSGLGSGVSDVAMAPGTRSLWATGGILTRLGGDAAIWSGSFTRTGRRSIDEI